MERNKIQLMRTNFNSNMLNLKDDALETGEIVLVKEVDKEKLYCKNTDNEIVPIHRIFDGGEFDLPEPTILSEWINQGIFSWETDPIIGKHLQFNNKIQTKGIYTPPIVSDMDTLISMAGLFYNCSELISIDMSSFNTINVTNIYAMFYGCSKLNDIDLSHLITNKIIDMSKLFTLCINLRYLNLNGLVKQNTAMISHMFNGCSNILTLDLSSWNTSGIINLSDLFNGCSNLKSLNLNGWNLQNATNYLRIFEQCNHLEEIKMIGCNDSTLNKIKNALTTVGLPENIIVI